MLLSRNPANYEPIAKEIEQAGGKATGISTDVTSAESVQSAFHKIKSLGDGGEVKCAAAVFNGAGSFSRKPFLDLTLDDINNGCVKAVYAPPSPYLARTLPLLTTHLM